jgi:hypothetical protein
VHGLLSLQFGVPAPAWQVPPPHASPRVQALPSSQEFVLFACRHPLPGLHESSVHGLLSVQSSAVPAWQLPPEQISPVVHAFPSLQGFVLLSWTQPLPGSQESSVHGLLSLQFGVPAPGWQLPPPHASPRVQALPSSQGFVLLSWTHPLPGSHASSVHGLLSLQFGVPPPAWQLPPPHASPRVQAFPSSQEFVLFV